MGRRHRHLNPMHLGATSALDARFLTGFSNGDPVTTWTSRTGTNSPTQATAGNRPLYQSAGINGNPSILFNAAGRSLHFSPNPVAGATAAAVVFCALRTSTTGGALVANIGTSTGDDLVPWTIGINYTSFASDFRKQFTAGTLVGVPAVESATSAPGAWTWWTGGVQSYTTASNTVAFGLAARLGSNNSISPANAATIFLSWTGHAGAIALFPRALTAPNRKRAEHAMAYSFKIPCS
jgi:hypothetical protein